MYIPNDLKSGSIGKLKTNVGPEEWLGYIKNAGICCNKFFSWNGLFDFV